MSGNYFDRFDAPQASGSGNYFDRFDAQPAKGKTGKAPAKPEPVRSEGYKKARAKYEQDTADTRARNLKIGGSFFGGFQNGLGDFNAQVARNIGAGDEIAGAASYLGQGAENLFRRATGRPVEITARDAGSAAMDYERQQQADYARAHPNQNALATIAAIATAGRPVAGAPPITNPLVAGGYAAAANAPFALTRQDGNIVQRLPGALKEEAITFGTGVAFTAAANQLARLSNRAAARPMSNARILSDMGTELTPGQMMGGTVRRIEDGLTSTPMVGDAIRSAQRNTLATWNRGTINEALAPIGKTLPANVNVGRNGIRFANRAVSSAYQQALAGVNVAPDAAYVAEIQRIMNSPNLTAAQRETLNSVVQDQLGRIANGADGATWKLLDSDIGKAIRAAQNASATQPGGNLLTKAFEDLSRAHLDLLQRQAPQAVVDAVNAADRATAMLMRIRKASSYTGTSARGGVFAAGDLNRAVQGMDVGAKRGFTEGDAMIQNIAEPAMQVLPSSVPDSGTPFRSTLSTIGALGAGVFGGSAAGAGELAAPAAMAAGAGLVAGSALYSRPVIAILNVIYRAARPGDATGALAQLGRMAAVNPALAPAYAEASRFLTDKLSSASSRPSPQASQPTPRTR